MAWTELTRAQHNRETGRYPSDLTEAEWAVADSDAFGHPFRSHPATCSEVFGHL